MTEQDFKAAAARHFDLQSKLIAAREAKDAAIVAYQTVDREFAQFSNEYRKIADAYARALLASDAGDRP